MEFNLCLFRKRMERVSGIKAPHASLVTMYLPPGKAVNEVIDELLSIEPMNDIDPNDTLAVSIRHTITAIRSHLTRIGPVVERNGQVLLFGEVGGKPFLQILEPPRPLREFIYKRDREFFLSPLDEMVSAEEVYGILVMDLAEATFGHLVGSKVRMLAQVHSQVPNKHHHGGMSSLRFERLRDDAINEYFKKVSQRCVDAFLNQHLRGIIIAGPAMTKKDFLSGEFLHHELRKLVIGTVDTLHTDEVGLKEALAEAEGLLSTCQYVQEKRLLDRFWEEVGRNGLEVSGLEPTRERLNAGQVESLLLSESVDLDTMEGLKHLADRFGTEVLVVSEEEDQGQRFDATVKVGGILRYK
ncbi:MAG: Peptide chain release factor subunit 1 [Methanomassiliicoccales archaeon PtaU1.Bin124]|nr:MAG: Peptide chain release factor subunit 1 [Methanomassiliicoccales archaeon PtaU1.Bin124]